jgi:hypothetical protein
MSENYAKTIFSTQYSKNERMRQSAKSRPLVMAEINALLSMNFNNEPLYPSIELFYSQEYIAATANGLAISEIEKIQKFRPGTDAEVNMLYSDIHAREDKVESAGAPSDS